ncbi:MAG TPA: nucleotide sugar dehydrogenase [Streptosporangiaceae bacterium]|nr:nucleotide sugar dehydrogenase [Streptosporangiaceae bacterium]
MTDLRLSLAVNGREHQLQHRLVAYPLPGRGNGNGNGHNGHDAPRSQLRVAIVGLGYVGLPTAVGLAQQCQQVTGVDISQERLDVIAAGLADLPDSDRPRLDAALSAGTLELSADPAAISEADAVIVCVPTPVDADHVPELSALRGACAAVVGHARKGQTIILTSTTYVGTTSEMLAAPLQRRGLEVGSDVFVAFSPERIDPGNPDHQQEQTPRVVGGTTSACAAKAAEVIGLLTDAVYIVSSPEAAEATKLYENIFRAVSLALANEFADVCNALQLDPIEVTLAAGTKPYGFLAAFPGPGVGGHCIPCDPHYLLWQLGMRGRSAPLIEQTMRSIRQRPERVVERAREVLAGDGRPLAGARVMVVGASYKPGVRDLRESSAVPMIASLLCKSADVHYFDPLVPVLRLPTGQTLASEVDPGTDWDLVIVHTVHPEVDYSWARKCRVLDATYGFEDAPARTVV